MSPYIATSHHNHGCRISNTCTNVTATVSLQRFHRDPFWDENVLALPISGKLVTQKEPQTSRTKYERRMVKGIRNTTERTRQNARLCTNGHR